MQTRRHSLEETVRLGEAIYHDRIRSLVEADHKGKIIAIEVDGGEYEIAETALIASRKLRERVPDAETFSVRIGYPTLRTMGGRTLPRQS